MVLLLMYHMSSTLILLRAHGFVSTSSCIVYNENKNNNSDIAPPVTHVWDCLKKRKKLLIYMGVMWK